MHGIIKEFGKINLHNVVCCTSQEKTKVEFRCDVCDEKFLDFQTLNVYIETFVRKQNLDQLTQKCIYYPR